MLQTLSTGRQRPEDQKFKVNVGFIGSFKTTWAQNQIKQLFPPHLYRVQIFMALDFALLYLTEILSRNIDASKMYSTCLSTCLGCKSKSYHQERGNESASKCLLTFTASSQKHEDHTSPTPSLSSKVRAASLPFHRQSGPYTHGKHQEACAKHTTMLEAESLHQL